MCEELLGIPCLDIAHWYGATTQIYNIRHVRVSVVDPGVRGVGNNA